MEHALRREKYEFLHPILKNEIERQRRIERRWTTYLKNFNDRTIIKTTQELHITAGNKGQPVSQINMHFSQRYLIRVAVNLKLNKTFMIYNMCNNSVCRLMLMTNLKTQYYLF